jgi:hypothetical protein
MPFLLQSSQFGIPTKKQKYSEFGFEPEKEESEEEKTPSTPYLEHGFEPEKRKAGAGESIWLGLQEGLLGLGGMYELARKSTAEMIEDKLGLPTVSMSTSPLPWTLGQRHDPKETPILKHLSTLPESEGQTARRLRAGTAAITGGAPFGIPGIIAGLIGSQAGQTVREVYGKDGKFENLGWGEGAALLVDLIAGGTTQALVSAARQAPRAAANQIPSIFRNPETGLQRSITKNVIQGEKQALENIINDFGRSQIQGFEQEMSNIAPNRYTDLVQSNASGIQQHTNNMFRNTQLNSISPLAVTLEQGGRALQESANAVFQREVIEAERNAYDIARNAAQGINGNTPQTIQQAKALRDNLLRNAPTSEQNPVLTFLNELISDLEENIAASTLVNAQGKPLVAAITRPRTRSANDLIDLIQRANYNVNYESQFREQSHRLKPVVDTLRKEVGNILNKNPQAASLYREANLLHGRNAETWGTKLMQNMRFTENPEDLVAKLHKASNMRNFKNAINDPNIQNIAERMVIDTLTEGGSSKANRVSLTNLSPELSLNAQNAAHQLINVKDPLTSSGGRAAVLNDILKDAAQSVNTGKRPEKILSLMETVKGFNLVRESLRNTPQSRELFNSFERLFLEDIFNSITHDGIIDFDKAKNILKKNEIRNVVREIGGDNLLRRFTQLEEFANNFERNTTLFKNPQNQGLIRNIIQKSKNAGFVGLLLRALHVPIEGIAALGLVSGGIGASKMTFNALKSRILNNARAVNILESISRANTIEELSKQLPRLIAEIDKMIEND